MTASTNPLVEIAAILHKRRGFVLAFTAAACAVTLVSSRLITPRYDSEALLLVTPGKEFGTPLRQAEIVGSKVAIATSAEVLGRSVDEYGVSQILGASAVQPGADDVRAKTREDAIDALRKSVTVRAEPNTDILRVVVRDTNPQRAAGVANVIARKFVERHNEIFSPQADFFRFQREKYKREYANALEALGRYRSANGMHSVEEQRRLYLAHQTEAVAALESSRASIAQKQAQVDSISTQLLRLKPVLETPYVAELIAGASSGSDAVSRLEAARRKSKDAENAPPLLLVKVYQEQVDALMKSVAELSGLKALAAQQELALRSANERLVNLASHESEYEALRQLAEVARVNAETYARKATDTEVETEFGEGQANTASVKIVQQALVSDRVAFPRWGILIPLSLLIGATLAMFLAVIFERFKWVLPQALRQHDARSLPRVAELKWPAV